MLPKLLITWVNQLYLITHHDSFIPIKIAYTTPTNSILWSTLNYKKLLQCVNTTNILRMNQRGKNALIAPILIKISNLNYKSC